MNRGEQVSRRAGEVGHVGEGMSWGETNRRQIRRECGGTTLTKVLDVIYLVCCTDEDGVTMRAGWARRRLCAVLLM